MSVVFVISGPAGVGKTTLCDRLIGEFSDKVKRIVTATTRRPRTGEVNGQDYHFLSKDEFLDRVNQGAFIEYECVHCGKTQRAKPLSEEARKLIAERGNYLFSLMRTTDQGKVGLRFQTSLDPMPYEQTQRKSISKQIRSEVWRRDGAECVQCGSKEQLQFDHIIPVSKGGATTTENLQLLCQACNAKKSNRI